jgi:hypothetical protein
MIKIHGKDYVEVNERLIYFWKGYPEGSIVTEVLKIDDNFVMIKAEVRKSIDQQIPDAVGHAFENKNSSNINKTSYVENCETSAIGRALGVLGYGIENSIASAEEVNQAIEQQSENKDLKPTGDMKAVSMGNAKVNAEELAAIEALLINTEIAGKDTEEKKLLFCEKFKIKDLKDLPKGAYKTACDTIIEAGQPDDIPY